MSRAVPSHPRRLCGGVLAAALLLPQAAPASEMMDKLAQDPALLAREFRALLLEEPELVPKARAEARARMAADAASDLAAEIAGDNATIADLSEALFAATPRGFGAATGPARLVVFTAAPCADCAGVLNDLHQLASEMPDLRIEVRSANAGEAELLARALEAAKGPEAALAYRLALAETPEAAPSAVLAQLGHDALPIPEGLRDTVTAEAALFSRLDLDTLPSYVMPGRLIRGAMPGIVLRRYLSE